MDRIAQAMLRGSKAFAQRIFPLVAFDHHLFIAR